MKKEKKGKGEWGGLGLLEYQRPGGENGPKKTELWRLKPVAQHSWDSRPANTLKSSANHQWSACFPSWGTETWARPLKNQTADRESTGSICIRLEGLLFGWLFGGPQMTDSTGIEAGKGKSCERSTRYPHNKKGFRVDRVCQNAYQALDNCTDTDRRTQKHTATRHFFSPLVHWLMP